MIYDKETLTREVFPAYFKHCNFKSFARQLNFYGFRKIKSKDKECCIYHHEYFHINRADLLPLIQRQSNENHHESHSATGPQNVPLSVVSPDEVNELKDKVCTLTATVSSLHEEIAGLKTMVTSLADVIRGHDEYIRQSQTLQVVRHTTDHTPINMMHTQGTTDVNEANDASCKPQAKQISLSAPNHGSTNIIDYGQSAQPSFSYVATAQRQEHEEHHAKKRKFSTEDSVAYAANVSRDQFALPPAACMHNETVMPAYEVHPHDHWTSHTTEKYIDQHHHHHHQNPMDNDHNVHNNSHNSIENQNTSTTETSHVAFECSADQDYGFEDYAWFALFEEDISHQPDDPTTAPQA